MRNFNEKIHNANTQRCKRYVDLYALKETLCCIIILYCTRKGIYIKLHVPIVDGKGRLIPNIDFFQSTNSHERADIAGGLIHFFNIIIFILHSSRGIQYESNIVTFTPCVKISN